MEAFEQHIGAGFGGDDRPLNLYPIWYFAAGDGFGALQVQPHGFKRGEVGLAIH